MEEDRADLLSRVANDNLALAVAQNIAANGRLFCTLIFAAHLAAFLKTGGPLFAFMALVATLPVGLAVISDATPAGPLKVALSALIYGFAVIAAFAFVFSVVFIG
ncbi:MAG TPA: hypothetical protein VIU82_21920 [Bosea sp. (in: a-proteobacteria)]